MDLRFFLDAETGLPHIYDHGVNEAEVEYVLRSYGEEFAGENNSRVKLGRTRNGRLLQVIFVPDETPGSVFVITAYEPTRKTKTAYRRRRRGKRS
jgi:hypothetical protein